jgi:hypothetical protein
MNVDRPRLAFGLLARACIAVAAVVATVSANGQTESAPPKHQRPPGDEAGGVSNKPETQKESEAASSTGGATAGAAAASGAMAGSAKASASAEARRAEAANSSSKARAKRSDSNKMKQD